VLDFLSNPAIEVGSGLATDPVDKVVGKVVAKEELPKRSFWEKEEFIRKNF
jgi:hypothetical protein